jgi:hypothetical protein
MLQMFVTLKNPLPSVWFEAINLGSNGKHANHYITEKDSKMILDADDRIYLFYS